MFFSPKLIEGKCPVCGEDLYVGEIICDNCHAHYPVESGVLPVAGITQAEDKTPYSKLSIGELNFLKQFLLSYGNFKEVAEKNGGMSYLAVKKKYADILEKLGFNEKEKVDLSKYSDIDYGSQKPSDIVMRKLVEAGGRIEIPLLGKKTCVIEVCMDNDGNKCFVSDKLNNYNYPYKFIAFDIIVDILEKHGGKMPKGNGRAKVGEKGCADDTLIGCFAKEYFGKKDGEFTYDPIFVFAAVLDWAGLAKNERGYLELY